MDPETDVVREEAGAAAAFDVDEQPSPRRTRRPLDVLRLVMALTGIALVLLVAVVGERTLLGLSRDLSALRPIVPAGPVELLAVATSLVGLVLPPALVVTLMVRGRLRTTAEMLAAGVVAAVIAAAVSWWLLGPAPEQLLQSMQPAVRDLASPVPPYPALLVAVVSVVGWQGRPRVRQAAWFAIGGGLLVGLLEGVSTVPGTLLALGIGRAVGMAVRLADGRPSVTPDGRAVGERMLELGYPVTAVRQVTGVDPHRYVVETARQTMDVRVLDRDREGAGLLGRSVQRLRLRREVLPREAVTMRAALDRSVLLSLAVERAGVRTPPLRRAVRLGHDAVLLVYEHVDGRLLAEAGEAVDDATLTDLWHQLAALRDAQIAHRRLGTRSVLVDPEGRTWLLDLSGGEVAAGDVGLRLDLAQALADVALLVGPQRTVSTAAASLGDDYVASAVPLLQPVALARPTRQALRVQRGLLVALRDRLVAEVGPPPSESLRLERLRPLSLVTGLGAVAALYLVGTQLSDVALGGLLARTDWRWLVPAVLAIVVNYLAAATALLGFVPERVSFRRTVAAQVALGFVRLIAPSTVGNAAINIRLLSRSGVPGPLAAASVAANQIAAVALALPLIAVLAVLTGSSASAGLDLSPTALVIAAAVVVVAALLVLASPVRGRAGALWREFAGRGLPRLLDVVAQPVKLAQAVGGLLLQTASFVLCFYACVQAVGGEVSVAALAVVYLAGNTVGTAVPTPGGLGAVEAALTAGLTAVGVPASLAVSAVLLFRLVSFWAPILPGWLMWTRLQRAGLV